MCILKKVHLEKEKSYQGSTKACKIQTSLIGNYLAYSCLTYDKPRQPLRWSILYNWWNGAMGQAHCLLATRLW